MPAERCKAGRGMAVGKHTFSLTLVVVTECAFCNAQLDECCYDSFHSWVHCSAVRCRNIAFLLGLSERKTALLFQSNALRHVLSQRFIDNQKPEKPPLVCPLVDMFTQFLANVFFKISSMWGSTSSWLPEQWLRNSIIRTIFLLLSSPNLSCCNLGLGNYP